MFFFLLLIQAHKGLLEYEDAKRHLKHVIELQPSNRDAREQLKSVLELINQRDRKDRNKYSKFSFCNAIDYFGKRQKSFPSIYRMSQKKMWGVAYLG